MAGWVGRRIEQVFHGKKLFRRISPLFHPFTSVCAFVQLVIMRHGNKAAPRVGAFHRVTGPDRFLLNTNTDTDTNTNTVKDIDTNKYTNTSINIVKNEDTITDTNTDTNTVALRDSPLFCSHHISIK